MRTLRIENKSRVNHKEQANIHTCKTLLNCYIREICGTDLHLFSVNQQTKSYSINFPISKITISGVLSHYSEIGAHEYESFYVNKVIGLNYKCVVQLIVKELQHHNTSKSAKYGKDFIRKVDNSYYKLSYILKESVPPDTWNYLASEQSVLYGHPFHPFPKNTYGFTVEEFKKFCPELCVSFKLCYFAVRKEVFQEDWIESENVVQFPNSVQLRAKDVLKNKINQYDILPMHPWQYQYVKTLQPVKQFIVKEMLVPLGDCGPEAYPTSSVRTVFIPEMNCNLKLSLNIQITNLIRNNNYEQIRRTLDATNCLLQNDCFNEELNTSISYEVGASTCEFGDEDITKLFTVLFRPIEFDRNCTYVLSNLIESPVGEEKSRLSTYIANHVIDNWFQRYLEISLVPLVRMAEEKGIHFEAHLQNSLLTIKHGMPYEFILRDLEGVSVDIEKVEEGIDITGPLYYEREETWERTSYYFIVNHLGSLIQKLAKDFERNERYFWKMVHQALAKEYDQSRNEFAFHLLTTKTFNAKQNLISCLVGEGETPSFVPVVNVIQKIGSELYAYDDSIM